MKNIACFDIGGTFIKYGILDEKGNIIIKGKIPSPKEDCKTQIPLLISREVNKIKNEYNILAIGISTAGKVDSQNGEIIFASEHLPNYTGTELSRDIKAFTGLDCYVENDVNSAAMGEYWKGAGKNADNFVCITLGTSIGGAIIIDGKLHKGVKYGAGELGHTVIKEEGEDCNCGGKGCYERYASTSALIRDYETMASIPKGTLNGKDIMNKVRKKDPLATKVYNRFLNHLVTGLINITHILDLGLIIIGGGISESGEMLFNDINNVFLGGVMPSYGEYTKIIKAELGNDAGLVGICYITLSKISE